MVRSMLQVSRPDHARGAMASPPTPGRSTRIPDWDAFYKNGLPREVIVIDDTPEPSTDPNSDEYSTSAYTIVPTTTQHPFNAKKRKAECDQSPIRPQDPLTAPNRTIPTANSASKRTGRPPPDSTDSPDPRGDQKRRRTRYQLLRQSSDRQQGPRWHGHYQGLEGPVVKAREVPVEVRGEHIKAAKKTTSDDDGHYIVVPDSHITNQYQIDKLLGQGTFGKVVRAYDRNNRQAVAVKVIRSVQKYRDAAKIELRVLQTLRQNDALNRYHCIHLRDCFDFQGHICIVTDLFDSSLFDFLKGNSFVPFPSSHIQSFARQLLMSVAYIHDLGLIHTDLKPENILLASATYQTFTYNRRIPSARTNAPRQATQRRVLLNPEIRLIDFGSATFEDEYHSSVVSTRHYRAPEIILGLGWSFPCDIWSIGCILVEFFTGDALFQTHDNLEHLAMMEAVWGDRLDVDMARKASRTSSQKRDAPTYFKRLKLNYPTASTDRASKRFVNSMKPLKDIVPPTTPFLKSFLDLLRRMLACDPAKRITAKEALQHPWFRESLEDDGTEAAKIAKEREARLSNGAA